MQTAWHHTKTLIQIRRTSNTTLVPSNTNDETASILTVMQLIRDILQLPEMDNKIYRIYSGEVIRNVSCFSFQFFSIYDPK